METTPAVSLTTIGRFLLGRRDAIESVATDPRSPAIGLALVFAASCAREYDAEYLLAEPWHVLFGPAASLGAGLVLALVVYVVLGPRPRGGPGLTEFVRRFLGLFWMTAPLAFIYAIPVERFLGDADAVRANLGMLGVVATWRVLLMIRVVAVFCAAPARWAVYPVLAMSASLAIAAISALDIQILVIMGGVRYTEAERVLRTVACNVHLLSVLSLPIVLLGCIAAAVRVRRAWEPVPSLRPQDPSDEHARRPRGPYVLAGAVLVALVPALPTTQREQAVRHEIEAAQQDGDDDRWIKLLESYTPADVPPHWRPRLARVLHPTQETDERAALRARIPRHWSAEIGE